MAMDNEELEWELHDIFESGLFAFPIYEHNGARRIVQYLIYRGVPDEEIAGHSPLHLFLGLVSRSYNRTVSFHQLSDLHGWSRPLLVLSRLGM